MDKRRQQTQINKKIAIITHYYNSLNYGGNLQAYALAQFLLQKGYSVEQLCYQFHSEQKKQNYSFSQKALGKIKKTIRHPIKVLIKEPKYKNILKKHDCINRQKNAMLEFNQNKIPHSDDVYNINNIKNVKDNYDVFITGSDQVWNFTWYNPAFFLDFVPPNKKKIAYAASISMNSFTEEQKSLVKQHLADFSGISVREIGAVKMLDGLTNIEPICVVDPVLLLDKGEWDKICAPRQVENKYAFCYFLGNNKKERKIAKNFAKKKNLELVNIFMPDKPEDLNLGDKCIFGAGPEEFISLIKNAEYVLTDSFHATVFSFIFNKQYFVFNRDKNASMSSRITHITELFGTNERFCVGEEKEDVNYLLSLKDVDYSKECCEFKKLRETSIEFLERNLVE